MKQPFQPHTVCTVPKGMVMMMTKPQIMKCCAREILDSRGDPTVEATVVLTDGTVGVAAVPSGASTGMHEACELRDEDETRFGGRGVREAVSHVCDIISPALSGMYAGEQNDIDRLLCRLDGTENKSKLGANAILSVSLAAARAAANYYKLPLYRYLGGADTNRMPVPMMNVLNGGAHASNNIEVQEFMIVPVGAESFSQAVRWGSEIYHALGGILRADGHGTTVGDEGGFAPDLASDEEAVDCLLRAIRAAGRTTDEVKISIDAAASGWRDERGGREAYKLPKSGLVCTAASLIGRWADWADKYPLLSVEDGLDEDDFRSWADMTSRIGHKVMLVGDDLFVTNTARLTEGIRAGAGNAILIKPNQIGTLSETLEVIRTAREAGYRFILSHRSGETEDTTIADIAVAVGAPLFKSGAPCRTERVAKYNRLMRIESSLGKPSYGL